MPSTLNYSDILNLKNKILVDVRSPKEYNEATIPGAINIPVLLDDERVEVGTLYVNKKISESKLFAVESISKRLPEIFRQFLNLSETYDNIIVFCARGGYRSKSISSFLNSLDIKNTRINNGYKGYRNYVLNNIDNLISTISPIVLYGNTGCGKTKIILELSDKGFPVIDLEGLAIHRGSILGAVGLPEQPTQKMFENILFEKLERYKNKYVFFEGESRRIGKILLPETLYEKMATSINIKITAPIGYRIENLVEEYASVENKPAIAEAIKRMNKYLSNKTVEVLLNALDNNDYAYIAKELCINYYDKKYKNRVNVFDYEFTNNNTEKVTNEIISKTKKYF
ncbi:tRNA 2-selenouridine(34) synthase MnmH [Peptostreptococcaceae bacterium OttesenSCG-928-C18]|nr:tRNA 2-selenouridine(34) synthase MnmH [Peptostreptococcaceae bacterium OttesenSCG-928-C18]